MTQALAAGAAMVNDVNVLRAGGALAVVAKSGVPVCLMHMPGEPRTMQINPEYDDVTREVRDYLHARAKDCIAAGIEREQIVIDPGFGFGKTIAHNLELLRNLEYLGGSFPVMVGSVAQVHDR